MTGECTIRVRGARPGDGWTEETPGVTLYCTEHKWAGHFEAGHDLDYLVKVRRMHSGEELTAGPLVIVADQRCAWLDGREMQLTRTEFDVLAVLAPEIGKIVFTDRIIREVWGWADNRSARKNLAMIISRMRRKFGDRGNLIVTVRDVGYGLADGS